MSGANEGGYNARMRLLLSLLGAACLLLSIAQPPVAFADDPARDPRCADWEQHGAPAGVDLRLVCAANQVIGIYTGQATTDTDADPLLPYAAAALITGVGLVAVGIVATRFVGRRAGRRLAPESPDAWWVCPSCQSLNADGRPSCYACHATRSLPGPDGGGAPSMMVRRTD